MADIFIQSIADIEFEKIYGELSELRRQKIDNIKNEEQKLLSAAAELALNKAVKAWFPDMQLPVDYKYDENGKPYLCDERAYISLSHSGELAVCAISKNRVGVDVQEVKTVKQGLAERFFSEKDIAYINSARDKKKAFFEVWVKNEARVKLTGNGISGGLKSDNDSYKYTFQSLDGDKYLICVCEEL